MQAISDLLLSIYDEAKNASTNEFVNNALGNIQKTLKFDSAGLISIGISSGGELCFKGGFAYRFSTEEKYKARVELGLAEKHVQGRGIVGSDPLLEKCFQTKNRAQIADVRTVPDKRLVEYARKTGAVHALCMLTDDANGGGFCSLSLWRAGEEDKYVDGDRKIADAVLPNFFMALSINKRLANTNDLFENTYFAAVVCELNGHINFIESEVFLFLQEQFHNWKPLYLPSVILDGLRADTSNIYVSKGFTAKGRVIAGTLLVYISKKSDSGSLTKIEFKVAQLLAEDVSYKEIAMRLGTSPATIRNQAHSIYKKLNISKKSSVSAALLLRQV
jgi:DNA-binding CsgD family transcriptional regulator